MHPASPAPDDALTAALAKVGEASLGMIHDMSNFLNQISMRAYILMRTVPAEAKPGLESIVQAVRQSDELLKQLRRVRLGTSGELPPVDAVALVRQAFAGTATALHMPAEMKLVAASTRMLARLFGRLAQLGRLAAVTLEVQEGRALALLHLELSAEPVPPAGTPVGFRDLWPGLEADDRLALRGLLDGAQIPTSVRPTDDPLDWRLVLDLGRAPA